MQFTYFALLTLVIPFSLPFAMDNFKLYTEKIEHERRQFREREQLRQDLHDNILNNLAKITMLSEMSLKLLDKDLQTVEDKLLAIKAHASEYSGQIRELLTISGEGHCKWEEFCVCMRKIGYDLVKGFDLDLELSCSSDDASPIEPSLATRVCLYYVFKEAVVNSIKYSRAASIKCLLSKTRNQILLEIRDDGAGFAFEKKNGLGHGLNNIQKRVSALRGEVLIQSLPDQGTCLKIDLPLF